MKDKVGVIIVVVVSGGLSLYLLWGLTIRTSIWISARQTTAQVINLRKESNKYFVVYQYKNEDDNFEYTVEKSITWKVFEKLNSVKELQIEYSTIFPSYTMINGVPDYSFIYMFIGLGLTAFATYRGILALKKKIPLSDFT